MDIISQCYLKAAGLAFGSAGAGYVGQKAAGMKVSFSWRAIVADAIGNLVSAQISESIGLPPSKNFEGTGNFGADLANGLIGGVVSVHTRRAFGFNDKIDYGRIALDAFGNALGNGIGRGVAMQRTARLASDGMGRQMYDAAWSDGNPFGDIPLSSSSSSSAMGAVRSSTQISNASGSINPSGAFRSMTPQDQIADLRDRVFAAEHQSSAREPNADDIFNNLRSAQGIYEYNPLLNRWETITVYHALYDEPHEISHNYPNA